MVFERLSTRILTEILSRHRKIFFEVSLANGYFCATHFLAFGGKKIYDTGIDSKDIKWSIDEFIGFYPSAIWRIDRVINYK